SEEHTSELQSRFDIVCRLLLEKKNLDGIATVLIMDTMGGETRQIEQPLTETLVRGPRTAFVENLGTNLSLLRRDIQAPNLRFKTHQIGRRSNRNLVVTYVDGIVNTFFLNDTTPTQIYTLSLHDALPI